SVAAPMPAETFRFLPPTTWPLTNGASISLEVCDSSWGSSGLWIRADHTVKTFPQPDRKGTRLVSYEIGGTGAAVFVKGPWSAGYPAYSANDPAEWTFSIVKTGGGAINTGDTVSLRIDSNW